MRAPAFWDARGHPAARLLAPLGALYGGLVAARMDRPGMTGPCPMVCVGNLTLGGAGKTPTALRVAAILRELGARPAFLSRGYGGRLAGPVAVDPRTHDAADVGDEPLLLARAATAVVARDRPAGARLCAANGADIVVMDDGLQNSSLAKDLTLAVVDAAVGIGNGAPFPAGPLRAPLDRQWPHVDAVILIGEGAPGEEVAALALARGLPIHHAWLEPDRAAAVALSGQPVFAFAGIGRPQKFFDTLNGTGARIVGVEAFPDHHPYRAADLARLQAAAEAGGATLVTTEKDWVRLPAGFAKRVATLPVTLRLADEAPLTARLRTLLEAAGSSRRT